ncbi:MAG TPA: SDR family NAD(P)-dependent oxidoreductase [Solirubrobacteraceae bacterium]|nr:SDR family NAD(P)-dependent oxidoreductase [Solirubrobacteraceae bacterium]
MSTRGRIVIGTLGLDQHEVGAMAVAQLLTRGGFEVIYLGRFNTPAKLAVVAQQEDADVVGVSVHSWELAAYASDLVRECHAAGAAVAVGGSVLTEGDEQALAAQGVDATFGPYADERTILARMDELVARARAGLARTSQGPSEDRHALAGRVAIVTGAARGLGNAYAEAIVGEGAAVVVNDVDAQALSDWTERRDPVAAVAGDISRPETSAALVQAARQRFGRLDAIVCNAGVLRSGTLIKVAPEDLDTVYAVHVRGTFLLLQAAARHWRAETKAGREVAAAAVTTTSSAGLYGFLGETAYSGAKAAIAAMTLVAAAELERYGVTVNAIAPAARTRMTAWMGDGPGKDSDDPYAPAHVAPVVAWLLSDAARAVTGRVFEVGGDVIAVADGWRPAASAELPRGVSVAGAGALVEQLLLNAPPPQPIQRPDPVLLR